MNKLFWGIILLALVFALPAQAMAMGARIDVGMSIPLPPPIVFSAPPEMVVIPETNVYVVPDVDVDIFFYGGWWWRPWEGRWYRSENYDSGWTNYQSVPSFYGEIPSRWRDDYRQRRWGGQPWNYHRIPQQEVHRNWNNWERDRHWERQNTWGVQGLKPRSQYHQPSLSDQPQQPRLYYQENRDVREQDRRRESELQSRESQRQQRLQQQEREVQQPDRRREQQENRREDTGQRRW